MPYWSLVVCVTFDNLKWVVQFTSTLYFPVQCHMSHYLKSYFLAFTFHYHSVPPWVHLLFAPALCRAEGTLFGCHEWHGGHSTPHFFFQFRPLLLSSCVLCDTCLFTWCDMFFYNVKLQLWDTRKRGCAQTFQNIYQVSHFHWFW